MNHSTEIRESPMRGELTVFQAGGRWRWNIQCWGVTLDGTGMYPDEAAAERDARKMAKRLNILIVN